MIKNNLNKVQFDIILTVHALYSEIKKKFICIVKTFKAI